MRHNHELEATIVEEYIAVQAFLDERGHLIWAATETRAISMRAMRWRRMQKARRVRSFGQDAGIWTASAGAPVVT